MRRNCARRARESGARRDRRPSADDHAQRPRRADGKRTTRGADGSRGHEQQGDRASPLCDGEDRRAAPRPRLPQARHQLAEAARGSARQRCSGARDRKRVTLPLSAEQSEPAKALAQDPLLDRDAEVAALAALLDATRSGDGRLVVIEGSAGIGKTRLLAEARVLAAAAEFDVLTARGGELEGQFAFGIVRQLFEVPLAGADPELRAELLGGAAGLSSSLFASAPTPSGEGAESSFAMLHGLYWLAANFASCKPMLVVVDDLHWADEPSLRWLVYL